jgi:hypothetical protein
VENGGDVSPAYTTHGMDNLNPAAAATWDRGGSEEEQLKRRMVEERMTVEHAKGDADDVNVVDELLLQ